MNSFAEAIKN